MARANLRPAHDRGPSNMDAMIKITRRMWLTAWK